MDTWASHSRFLAASSAYRTPASRRVADLRNWPRPAPLGFRARTRAWAAGLWRALRKERRPLDPVTDAKRRANQLIMARLECRESGAAFCVGTYHMPCQFRVPVVMVTHMALALRELQLWAGAAPLIFCGDFNVKPPPPPYCCPYPCPYCTLTPSLPIR